MGDIELYNPGLAVTTGIGYSLNVLNQAYQFGQNAAELYNRATTYIDNIRYEIEEENRVALRNTMTESFTSPAQAAESNNAVQAYRANSGDVSMTSSSNVSSTRHINDEVMRTHKRKKAKGFSETMKKAEIWKNLNAAGFVSVSFNNYQTCLTQYWGITGALTTPYYRTTAQGRTGWNLWAPFAHNRFTILTALTQHVAVQNVIGAITESNYYAFKDFVSRATFTNLGQGSVIIKMYKLYPRVPYTNTTAAGVNGQLQENRMIDPNAINGAWTLAGSHLPTQTSTWLNSAFCRLALDHGSTFGDHASATAVSAANLPATLLGAGTVAAGTATFEQGAVVSDWDPFDCTYITRSHKIASAKSFVLKRGASFVIRTPSPNMIYPGAYILQTNEFLPQGAANAIETARLDMGKPQPVYLFLTTGFQGHEFNTYPRGTNAADIGLWNQMHSCRAGPIHIRQDVSFDISVTPKIRDNLGKKRIVLDSTESGQVNLPPLIMTTISCPEVQQKVALPNATQYMAMTENVATGVFSGSNVIIYSNNMEQDQQNQIV